MKDPFFLRKEPRGCSLASAGTLNTRAHVHTHAYNSGEGKTNISHSLLMVGEIVPKASGRLNHLIFVGGTHSPLLLQGEN